MEVHIANQLEKHKLSIERWKWRKCVSKFWLDVQKLDLKEHKDIILNQIRHRRYNPQPVKRVQIPKENGKKRNLGITTVTDRSWSISIDERIKKINYLVRGWVNYFRIANMKNNIAEIDEHLRTRIRVIIWKQWKKIRKKYNSLRQLGVSHEIAFNCANTRKWYYQICKSRYIQFAINNERLRKRGLVFLLDQYEKVHI